MKKFRLINFPLWIRRLFGTNIIYNGLPFVEGVTKPNTFLNKSDLIYQGGIYNTTNR